MWNRFLTDFPFKIVTLWFTERPIRTFSVLLENPENSLMDFEEGIFSVSLLWTYNHILWLVAQFGLREVLSIPSAKKGIIVGDFNREVVMYEIRRWFSNQVVILT